MLEVPRGPIAAEAKPGAIGPELGLRRAGGGLQRPHRWTRVGIRNRHRVPADDRRDAPTESQEQRSPEQQFWSGLIQPPDLAVAV